MIVKPPLPVRYSQAYYKMAGFNAYRLGKPASACLLRPTKERNWWMAGYNYAKQNRALPFSSPTYTLPEPSRPARKVVTRGN